jgi:recombinational DNA repair ATPase RecF
MQIQSVEIQNFKNIKNKSVALNGNNVFLVAPNGKGKTSFIDACFGAMPQQPLMEGAQRGNVKINVGDYVVEFKFSARSQKPKMNIFDANGNAQTKPVALFKKLFGVVDFNIDTFINQSPTKQIEFIKEITGIDWADVDERNSFLYDTRRLKNRELKELEGKIDGRFFDPNLKPIDFSEIAESIRVAMHDNQQFDRISDGAKTRGAQIDDINNQIQELKTKREFIENEVKKANLWLIDKVKVDVSELQNELSEATERNEKISENTKVGELREQSSVVAAELDDIQKEMDEIKETKRRELENTPLPVTGLELDEDKLLLDGLPFNDTQINTARRIIAGLELQFQMMTELKIARFDGSLLDNNNLEAVQKWAEEKGIQLFVELVDRNGDELKIEVCEK